MLFFFKSLSKKKILKGGIKWRRDYFQSTFFPSMKDIYINKLDFSSFQTETKVVELGVS